MNKSLLALSVAALLIACGTEPPPSSTETLRQDILAANIDSSVRPGDDFFLFACGTWLKNNPIPTSENSWSMGHVVYEELYTIKRSISEKAAANKDATGDEKKVGDFWSTGMDSAKAEKLGWQPLAVEFDAINAIENTTEAVKVAARLNRRGCGAFWRFYVAQDDKNSDVMAVYMLQGGLGLPDRDYYFNKEEGVAKDRAAYTPHIARMLMLIGQDNVTANKNAADVMAFETALATGSRKMEDLRDPYKNYNKMAVAELVKTHCPRIDVRNMLDTYGLQACDTVIVGQPEFYSALNTLLGQVNVEVLKNYLRFHLLSSFADYLSPAIDQENFNFYETELSDVTEQRPRWKRVLDAEERAIGMILGKVFVRDYFNAKVKERYNNLVEAIRSTYGEHIRSLDWMSDSTKTKALEKLSAMTKKVVYPDHWKDMSTLEVGRESYADNVRNAREWRFDEAVNKFGKPVDRTEWDITPQTYNAYYNPSNNEIVLPAGIFLIAGLPDSLADDALIYGYAAASTIGHEITHGFDDQGRQYDAKGNLRDWWIPKDAEEFNKRSAMIVAQFDAYEPIKGLHIKGDNTQGENIADLGGIVLGLDAFKKTEQYKKGEKIAGFTPLQRYFLGYALGWLGHEREGLLRQVLMSDVHSPAKYRVNGPFSNIPEFYEAFGIKEGDAMWRPDSLRVRIW